MTNPARAVVSIRFICGGALLWFAWKALVIGILPWFGLEGLPTRSVIRLEGIQTAWVAYSVFVVTFLLAALCFGNSRIRAMASLSMAGWYLLYLVVISTPVVSLLYAGHAIAACAFAGVLWKLNGSGDHE